MPAVPRSKKKTFLFLIVALFLCLCLVVAVIEIGFRAMGRVIHRDILSLVRNTKTSDFLIVCGGDSHTEGTGVPPGYDYPSQLKAILNKEDRTKKYEVINLGVAGFNSSQTVNRILKYISLCPRKVDLIILSGGKNNPHNFTEGRILPEDIRKFGPTVWVNYLLAQSRTLQLGEITMSRLKQLKDAHAQYNDLSYDHALDVNGPEEQALVTKWIVSDVQALYQEAKKRGTRLSLLNYWDTNTPWVDNAFEEACKNPDIIFLDIRRFGRSELDFGKVQDLVQKDWHPNAKGFALIAGAIYAQLVGAGIVPQNK